MAKLTITRGLPGSGKTTWAKAQRDALRVNRDELRRMLHGGWTGDDRAEKQVTRAQHATIEALLRAGGHVIADDTNLAAKVVRTLTRVAEKAGAQVDVVDFTHVSLETCIQRDAERAEGEKVGEEVIRRMHERYLTGREPAVALPDQPERKPDAILVDLDGTVAIMGRRSPYDTSRVHLDTPNQPVIRAVRAMYEAGHTIIYCSGRTDDGREATEVWLDKHVGVPHAGLHMRVTGDSRKDSVVKQAIYERELKHAWHIVAVFDDRNQVVRMWRSLGLTVFQVADGDF
jgi:predicted kinase